MTQKQLADIFASWQTDLLTARVHELYNFGETTMMQTQTRTAYGKLSVFYIPCGECGNPMAVKEVYKNAVLLSCEACGHESETDKLPFTESCYITIEANDFNQVGDTYGN